jgi:hypothetical protein
MAVLRNDRAGSFRSQRRLSALLLFAAGLVLSGCGGSDGSSDAGSGGGGGGSGGGGGGGGSSPPPPAQTVESSLIALGFDTRITPRRDSDGIVYPPSYSPFGARVLMTERSDGTQVFGNPTELVLAGFRLRNENEVLYTIDHIANPSFATPPLPTVLYRRSAADVPWALESLTPNDAPQTRRDAAAADVDGDGLQELVLAYVDGNLIRLVIKDFDAAAATEVTFVVPAPPSVFPVAELRVAAADFNQDGRDEVVIGVAGGSATSEPRLLVLGSFATGLVLIKQLSLPRTIAGSSVSLVLKTGSIDYDGSGEVAVVVNELLGGLQTPTQAAANFYVYDDHASDYVLLKSGPVAAEINGLTVTARVGHVTIGDIDNNQAGEVLLAGLTELNTNCEPVEHLLIVLDDGIRGFRQRSASAAEIPIPDCDDGNPNLLRHAFVNTLDVDGDDDLEIQVNQYVFQEAPTGSNWDASPGLKQLGTSALFPNGQQRMVFDRSNSAMTVADVNGDGRDDIVSFRQGNEEVVGGGAQATTVAYIDIYGTNDSNAFTRIGRIELTPEDSVFRHINPIIVAIAPDVDGQVLEYANDHKLVFTEAIVLAALAAPPCGLGIGQNTDDCTTTWGKSQSVGAEGERELRFEMGVAWGFEVEGGALVQSDTGSKIKLSAAASTVRSQAYELSKSVSVTTGPMEDSVVFSMVPLDTYTYRVIVHPNPARVGSEIIIGLPRTPTTRLTERTYYNAHLPQGVPTIGANVFDHTPGSINSYPNPARKEQILEERRLEVARNRIDRGIGGRLAKLPVFDPVPPLTGLQSDSPGVGQGAGSTAVSLELNKENGVGTALERAIEFETSTTVLGAKLDLNFGFSSTWSFKMTHGEGSVYEGSVGSIDAANFAAQQYRFGLFTYLQADSIGREFEVINYWVER